MVQRRGGKYRIQIWVMEGNQRVKRSFSFTRKIDADKKLAENRQVRELMRSGLEVPADDILVLDYARGWMKKRAMRLPMSTTEMDGSRLKNYVLPQLGGYPMKMVTTAMLRDLLDQAQESQSLSNSTRNRIRAVLHTMFHDAFMDEKIMANPVARIPLLEERPTRPRALTQAEAEDLIQECYRISPSIGLCAAVMVWQGLRVSNAVALQNRDFLLGRNELRVDRLFEQESATVRDGVKGNPEGLILPLFPKARAAYLSHLAATEFKRPSDYCMRNQEGGMLSTYRSRWAIKKAARAIGLPNVTPHVLRATFASLAEETGYSKEDVQRMMGHSSVTVTQRYIRRTAQPLVEKGEKLGFGAIAKVVQIKRAAGDKRVTVGREKGQKRVNSASRKTALSQRKER